MAEHDRGNVPVSVGGEGSVETKDRGLFDFSGKKDESKPQEEVIATEFDQKVGMEDKHKGEGEEKKHSTIADKLRRSYSGSSSSSDEEKDEEKKKEKKEKKGLKEKIEEKFGGEKKEEETKVPVEKSQDEVVQQETEAEKKGLLDKIKEKIPGQQKKADQDVASPPPTPADQSHTPADQATTESHDDSPKEKKGILEKIKDKIPGYHSKTEEDKEKEKEKEKEKGSASN